MTDPTSDTATGQREHAASMRRIEETSTMGGDMNRSTWQPDWPFRAYERLEQLGFYSLSEFMDSSPMVSLVSLANELGPGIAAVQLEALWYREAEERDRVAHLLGSLLIKC